MNSLPTLLTLFFCCSLLLLLRIESSWNWLEAEKSRSPAPAQKKYEIVTVSLGDGRTHMHASSSLSHTRNCWDSVADIVYSCHKSSLFVASIASLKNVGGPQWWWLCVCWQQQQWMKSRFFPTFASFSSSTHRTPYSFHTFQLFFLRLHRIPANCKQF